jgi:hypothetical protein
MNERRKGVRKKGARKKGANEGRVERKKGWS